MSKAEVSGGDIMLEKIENMQNVTVKLIGELMTTEKAKKISGEVKLRNLSDINANLNSLLQLSPSSVQTFAKEELIVYVRYFLIESVNKIPPIDFFKILMVSESVVDKYIEHSIPLYIARVIQREEPVRAKQTISASNYEDELFQALRFIGQWLDKYPKKFPQYFAFCIMSLTELPVLTTFQEKKKDHIAQYIKSFLVDIMLNMATKNTELCCICGGFLFLVNSITDPSLQDKSYDILSRLLFFINDPVNRELTSHYIDLKKIFHYLTDLDNIFLEETYKIKSSFDMLGKFHTKLGLAKNAIITLFKSWAGVIYLGNDARTVASMLEALKQIPRKSDSEIRIVIFEILDEILSVGDYILAASASEEKGIFRMSNLLGCYLMTVVELLIDQDILRVLIEFSGVEDSVISEPAQRLLKRLTLLIFSFRPESSKYIDFLITTAMDSQQSGNPTIRSSSSFMINKIGNYIYDRKSKKNHPMFNELENLFSLKTIFVPYLRASVNSISKSLNFINFREKEGYRRNLLEANPIAKEHKENYLKWRWEIIENLLSFPDPEKFKSSANERYRENKLYKYLLRFYSPSRGNFTQLPWEMENFLYIKCGRLMVKNSITIPENLPLVKNPPESQFECTVSFIGDLEKYMEISISQCLKDDADSRLLLFTTLQRELISFIGYFSENKVGYEALLCENRFFELLYGCLHREECSYLVYLLLINLDFLREDVRKSVQGNTLSTLMIGPKALLEKCVKEGSKSIKFACVQIVKILLKSELLQFSIFSYKILIYILWKQPPGNELIHVCTSFLEQHLSNKATIELFLNVFTETLIDFEPSKWEGSQEQNESVPLQNSEERLEEAQVTKISSSIINFKLNFAEVREKLTTSIITRFLSNEKGLELVEKFYPDWLNAEFEKWHSPQHNYCVNIDSKLNKSLNFAKKKDKSFYKITGNSNTNVYDLLFLYKLPWILYINEQKYPLWVRQVDQRYQLYADLSLQGTKPCLVSRMNDSVKIMLGIGSMLVNEEFQLVNSEEGKTQLSVFLSINSRETKLFGEPVTVVESHGVEIYYKKWEMAPKEMAKEVGMTEQEEWEYYSSRISDMNKLEIRRVVINIWVPSTEHMEELPLHLINQLNKTDRGREFIKNKGYIKRAYRVISEFSKEESKVGRSLVEVRSTLWSLGFFGSTNEGIKILHEAGIYQIIIKTSMQCPTLSIRGTCRYVMNMFTHSESGRSFLVNDGFIVNSKCFSCYPAKISEFCHIEDSSPHEYLLNPQYWEDYKALQKPMTKNEEKLFECISLLINSLTFKSAASQIRELMKVSPKMANSVNLLQNVVNLLTFFKYKHEARKSIMNVFDELIRSGEFNNQTGGKLAFYIAGSAVANSRPLAVANSSSATVALHQ